MAKLFRVAAVALGLLVLSTFGLVQQVTGLAADRTVTTRETITGLDAKAEVVRRMGLDPVFLQAVLTHRRSLPVSGMAGGSRSDRRRKDPLRG